MIRISKRDKAINPEQEETLTTPINWESIEKEGGIVVKLQGNRRKDLHFVSVILSCNHMIINSENQKVC